MKESENLYNSLKSKDLTTTLLNEAIHCAMNNLDIWDTPWANSLPIPEKLVAELSETYNSFGFEPITSATKLQDLIPNSATELKWIPLCWEIAQKYKNLG